MIPDGIQFMVRIDVDEIGGRICRCRRRWNDISSNIGSFRDPPSCDAPDVSSFPINIFPSNFVKQLSVIFIGLIQEIFFAHGDPVRFKFILYLCFG